MKTNGSLEERFLQSRVADLILRFGQLAVLAMLVYQIVGLVRHFAHPSFLAFGFSFVWLLMNAALFIAFGRVRHQN
jgi:hypothetical protein